MVAANLSDSASWTSIYNRVHSAQLKPDKEGKYFPIVPVIIPDLLDYYTVAIHCSVENARQTWRFEGKAHQIISVPGSAIVVSKLSKGYSTEVNFPTIIEFPKLSTYYRIAFYFPEWFINANLQIWVYTGSVPLKTIEDRLTAIEEQLSHIEEKIDTITSPSNP